MRTGPLGSGVIPVRVATGTVEWAVTQLKQTVAGAEPGSVALVIVVEVVVWPENPHIWAAWAVVAASRMSTHRSVIQLFAGWPSRVLVIGNVTGLTN